MNTWPRPAEGLKLNGIDVHIYRANLDRPPAEIARLVSLLSAKERARAGRFHFERDRTRFIAGRGILRNILGNYLEIAPADVRFQVGEHGKPALAATLGRLDLQFNLAHSREMALLAFTLGRQIGVDIEYCHPLRDVEAIVARFFSSQEGEVFFRLPAEHQQQAFFSCWTRKEAFIKAVGDGLTFPLGRFSVAFAPGEEARLLEIAGDAQEAQRWSLKALSPAPEYAAALAVAGHGWQLSCWTWLD